MADIIIPAKEAHQALKNMLDQLAKIDQAVKDQLPRKGDRPSNARQWEDALRTAKDEIEEWCPSFTMVVSPKK